MKKETEHENKLYGVTETEYTMAMDSLQRTYVDEVAEDHNVELEYGEGEVKIQGINQEQVEEFLTDVYRGEKSMEGKNHPDEFNFPEDDPFSALEKVPQDKKAVTDGGSKKIDPSEKDPRYNAERQPYVEENGEFGSILTGK